MALLGTPAPSFTPTATKVQTPTNYLTGGDFNYLNQFLPDLQPEIVKRYNSGNITGLIEALGSMSACGSDNFKWAEEGRLEQLITGATRSTNVFTFNNHTMRVGQTFLATNAAGSINLQQGIVTAVTTNTFTALSGEAAGWDAGLTSTITIVRSGNEFQKESDGMTESLNSVPDFYENTFVTSRGYVKESGSNLTLPTWLKVTDGTKTGYVWYYQNYNDTEKRFANDIEYKAVEGKKWTGSAMASAGYQGQQGILSAIGEGNIFGGTINDLDDLEDITERMNKQGAISENYFYGTSGFGISFDRMVQAENVTGVSWGAFDNSKDMAVNFEFNGAGFGGYQFYKCRWRYLDSATGRGALPNAQKLHAIMLPYGSKDIYDKDKNASASLPLIHQKYRANKDTDRKYQMWMTGGQAPVPTNAKDILEVHFLTERMTNVISRNNTMKFEG
jgi:hypothetical protein